MRTLKFLVVLSYFLCLLNGFIEALTLSTPNEAYEFYRSVSVYNNDYQGETVYISKDIDFSEANVPPIGGSRAGYGAPFKGTFDGQGHTIKIKLDGSYGEASAFFAVAQGATIKNLILEGVSCGSTNTHAGFVGRGKGLKFVNCTSRVTVSGSLYSSGCAAGFLARSSDGTLALHLMVVPMKVPSQVVLLEASQVVPQLQQFAIVSIQVVLPSKTLKQIMLMQEVFLVFQT